MNFPLCLVLCLCLHSLAFAMEMEEVVVTSGKANYLRSLQKLDVQQDIHTEDALPVQNLAELVINSPDAALNGQGGMLQMYSIRGLSRWRVQTLVEGVPIITDRRAGSGASFVPPAFIGKAELIPGAASSTFGSGALGGVVNLRLPTKEGLRAGLSFDSNQDSANVSLLSSSATSDLGLSYRSAGMGSDADGNALNDGLEHLAGLWRQRNASGVLRDAWVLVSEGNNWGKSSSRFPNNRRTHYPENKHFLLKTQLHFGGVFLEPYLHRAHLQTNIQRSDTLTVSENNALNYGLSAHGEQQYETWQYSWRAGMRARRDVQAEESIFDNQGILVQSQTTLAGDEQTLFAHMDVVKPWKEVNWVSGLRSSYTRLQGQKKDSSENDSQQSDSNWSGYSGLRWQLHEHWSTAVYLSTAYRTPALTELFFQGETPRGQVLGNLHLASENAVNIEYDLTYKNEDLELVLSTYHQQVDNYIERLDIDEDVLQYQNLDRADIQGLSYRLNYQVMQEKLYLTMMGQWLSGEDEEGNPLVDISPHHHRLTLGYLLGDIHLRAALRHRMSKNTVAAGEQALPALTTFTLGIEGKLYEQWRYRLGVNNVTNELARTTTDKDAPYIRGRQAIIELQFTM